MAGKQLVVLGGGLSGLCYLHYLRNFIAFFKKRGCVDKITLIEGNPYMGGSIRSQVFDDGLVHELGPRSIRTMGVRASNTAILMEELGLADKILYLSSKSAAGRNRYIYKEGTMHKVPSSFAQLFSRLPCSKTTLLGAVYNDVMKAPSLDLDKYPYRDPPLYDFIKHRFGEDAAENIADPIIRGITAGDARNTSTCGLVSDMLKKEQVYGSIIRSLVKPPVTKMAHDDLFPNEVLNSKLLKKFEDESVASFSLSNGLQTIPEHLSNSLLNTNDDGLLSIYNSTKVTSIDFNTEEAPCVVTVKTVDGDSVKIHADHLVSAIPAKNFTEILPESMPKEHKKALGYVTEIPHAPVGCVAVEYRNLNKKFSHQLLNSFGFLTHSKEGRKVLGISFDSAMFPKLDEHFNSIRITCMIGGAWFKDVLGTDDPDEVENSQLEQIALEEIETILKLKEEPHRMSTLLWKTGIAQYRPGHVARLEETRKKIQELSLPLTLIGQSYDGVAINDVTFSARMAAYDFAKSM